MSDEKIIPEEDKATSVGQVATAAATMMIGSLGSKILGFVRELLIGRQFGATGITDAYLVSLTVPGVIFAVVAGALATTFIPVYSDILSKEGKTRGISFAQNLFNLVLAISLALTLLGIIFANPIVKWVAQGFTGETLAMTVDFTRVTMFICIFVGASNILTGFLQSHSEFTIPAIIGLPYNTIIIFSLLLSDIVGIWGVVIATVLAAFSQVAIQWPTAFRQGFRFKLSMDLSDRYLRQMGTLLGPVVIGTGVSQINVLVDRILASGLAEGSISALNYANRLNGFAFGIFTTSVATVIYPTLSSFSARGNTEGFKKAAVRAMSFVITIMLPITLGAMILRTPIIRFLFEGGAFDATATQMTATALFYYSMGMVFYGLRDVLNRCFYSLKDTLTPMINGALAMGINIVLNLLLVRVMGLGGLAFATSISALMGTFLLLLSLRKKIGPIGGKKLMQSFLKSLISCSAMVLTIYLFSKLFPDALETHSTLKLGINLGLIVIMGAVVYFLTALALKMEEIIWAIEIIKTKLSQKLNLR